MKKDMKRRDKKEQKKLQGLPGNYSPNNPRYSI